MKARDIMTAPVETLSPQTSIKEAVRRFRATRFQAFPVIGTDGTLLGVLNLWDMLLHALPRYIVSGDLADVRFAPDLNQFHERLAALGDKPISSIMDKDPARARLDYPALECAALMLHAPHRAHLLPVVDDAGRLAGVIAPWDLIKEIEGPVTSAS